MSAPVAAAALAAALALVAALAGALLELLLEELDEHAASSSAAPTARTPNAARAARGFRLLILSMHPRIYIQGLSDHSAHRVVARYKIVNRPVNKEWVSLRSLSPDQQRGATNVSSRHIARRGAASIGCAVAFTGLMQGITSSDFLPDLVGKHSRLRRHAANWPYCQQVAPYLGWPH